MNLMCSSSLTSCYEEEFIVDGICERRRQEKRMGVKESRTQLSLQRTEDVNKTRFMQIHSLMYI